MVGCYKEQTILTIALKGDIWENIPLILEAVVLYNPSTASFNVKTTMAVRCITGGILAT